MSALPAPIPLGRAGPVPRRSARARRRLEALGPSVLDDAELMSLACGASVPACQALLDDDPSLRTVTDAGPAAVSHRSDLTAGQAVRLVTAVALGRRLAAAPAEPGWRIRSPADVGERLLPAMRHLEREELRTLLLNTKNVVTATRTVYVGNLAGSSVRVGEVFRDAVRQLAASIVVVHNHPSGDPTPSADDLRITAELAEAGRLLDIELLDHLVIGADGWVSLRSLGVT